MVVCIVRERYGSRARQRKKQASKLRRRARFFWLAWAVALARPPETRVEKGVGSVVLLERVDKWKSAVDWPWLDVWSLKRILTSTHHHLLNLYQLTAI